MIVVSCRIRSDETRPRIGDPGEQAWDLSMRIRQTGAERISYMGGGSTPSLIAGGSVVCYHADIAQRATMALVALGAASQSHAVTAGMVLGDGTWWLASVEAAAVGLREDFADEPGV